MSYAGAAESHTYDTRGRLTATTNPLGTFTHVYEGNTGILTELQYPLAGMKTVYERLPALQDRLMTGIIHHAATAAGGGELARYEYTYTANRQIATWQQTQPGLAGREWAIGYDARQQVSAITEQPLSGPLPSPQQVWHYQYDLSGNRTAAQEGNQTRTATYNHLNQITGLSAGGTTWFRGQVNEPANVTINGQNARVYADGTFEALTELGAGVHDVPVQATDQAGNVTSETWRVDNGPASGAVPTHDAEGNLLTDGYYTYTWDARNRMESVSAGTDTWTFQYDGQNRRISESKNGNPVREWVWHGTRVIEERLPNGSKHRFWTGGIEILDNTHTQTGKRLLLHDHLGSTRVVVDGITGTVTARYDHAPWGQRTIISGSEDWGAGYTGHWWHESGLSLAVYRPYDPRTGRWPSRDPIGERSFEIPRQILLQSDGGRSPDPALYNYSKNNFFNMSDFEGLEYMTLETSNDYGSFVNDLLHQNVCVTYCNKKACFSYAADGAGIPAIWLFPYHPWRWLKWRAMGALFPSQSYPLGRIYQPEPDKSSVVEDRRYLTEGQALNWLSYMVRHRRGLRDIYTPGRTCRTFAQWEYRDAPLHY